MVLYKKVYAQTDTSWKLNLAILVCVCTREQTDKNGNRIPVLPKRDTRTSEIDKKIKAYTNVLLIFLLIFFSENKKYRAQSLPGPKYFTRFLSKRSIPCFFNTQISAILFNQFFPPYTWRTYQTTPKTNDKISRAFDLADSQPLSIYLTHLKQKKINLNLTYAVLSRKNGQQRKLVLFYKVKVGRS